MTNIDLSEQIKELITNQIDVIRSLIDYHKDNENWEDVSNCKIELGVYKFLLDFINDQSKNK